MNFFGPIVVNTLLITFNGMLVNIVSLLGKTH